MKGFLDGIKRWGRILRVTLIRKIIHLSRKVKVPGFEGISLWEILFFFGYSIRNGFVTTRASSLAFHFFLAMIPFGLILVVLSDSFSFFDLDHDVIPVLGSFIPEDIFNNFVGNLHEFQHSTVNSLISVGFVIALYFTSNGFNVMIKTFNHSKIDYKKRKWWAIRITSFILVVVFVIGILLMFIAILYMRKLFVNWTEVSDFAANNFGWMFTTASLILVMTWMYFGIALLYYWAPSKRKTFRFFSAGASLATILIVLISEGYSLYIQNFARYNELYGSLGTIMALMLWMYFISFALLIGFELNASIHGAITHRKLNNFKEIKDRYDKSF
ncbi:MAG: YihY/virulence factor BrkB family protein [Flavobacteriales bacterium]|nr:YihY/virulence factor BrkB family protein [Flavobacteriales bacterium]